MATSLQLLPKYALITATQSSFNEIEAKSCLTELKKMPESRSLVVLDFTVVGEIAMPALRMLIQVASQLQRDKGRVVVICTKEIALFIRQQGLDRLFQCVARLTDVDPDAKVGTDPSKALEFLQMVLQALQYTFKTMAKTDVVAGKSYVRKGERPFEIDIAAIAPITSQHFNGALIIGFPQATYLGLMSRMVDQKYETIAPEIRDGAAEFLNIIVGQTKAKLNDRGFAIQQTIPAVVEGKNIRITATSQRPSVVVPYTSDIGPFFLEATTSPESLVPV